MQSGGQHGDQNQADQPPFQLEVGKGRGGLDAQVHAQEVIVHLDQPVPHALNAVPVGSGPVLGDKVGQINLFIRAIRAVLQLLRHVAQGDSRFPQGFAGLIAQAHEVGNGLADDGVQRHQDKQRQQGPHTAAHGVDALLHIELLQLLLILLLVFGVLLLQLRLAARQPPHPDHTPL